ncbi:cellulase family glycosylhydrolase [Pedobacter faecalis]|uniref:cellulase family glycosylhydrolase n=1 Tax=Pedobacter faecalis TaxID=3041495 RepID=UPI00254C3583|nr:cellulase family glycosylhydrolase [Pedobacter sp. ELA7]
MKSKIKLLAVLLLCTMGARSQTPDYLKPVAGQWTKEKANQWYAAQPWLVGANYLPATAINQIEMWQASTWDPKTIEKEFGWAQQIGMNTMRVFLHDMVWASDKKGLYNRMNQFLNIAQKYGIRPFFVFFDDCHFPNPALGVQPLPVIGYHNSGWVNSPARDLAVRFAEGKASANEVAQLKGYVQETMKHFKNDKRVLMWELYNEPGRGNNLDGAEKAAGIGDLSNKLLYESWKWAREINPSQPITGTAKGSLGEMNIKMNRINADVLSVHSYENAEVLERVIKNYQTEGRPIIMTEWLARTQGSTVEDCLPILKKHNVGAVNWGFVSGKSATVWPWTSRRENGKNISLNERRAEGKVLKPGEPFPEPELWFHDLYRTDGTPFSEKEIKVFKQLTSERK